MIQSINTFPSGTQFTADICIVGGGPVGISLALRLRGRGYDVVLLEGGDKEETKEAHALFEGEVVDLQLHSPATEYRHRVLGGASSTWGGRCIPFDPIDFDPREWISNSGWPITADDVAPYYADALKVAEAGDNDYDPKTAVAGGMRPMISGWKSKDFHEDTLERFSCPTNFGKRWAEVLDTAPGIRVLLNANVTEIVTTPDGAHVSQLEIRTLAGNAYTLAAKQVILSTGGIEVARLLLASRRFDPRGVGNSNDLVGRYYMCHLSGSCGEVHFRVPPSSVDNEYERSWDGVYIRRRIQPLPEAQRRLRVGNVVFRLHHPRLPNPSHGRGILSLIYLAKPFISYEYAKRLHSDDKVTAGMLARHVINVVRECFHVALFLINWARKRTFASRKYPSLVVRPRNNVYTLEVHSEQVPNKDSRIMLSDRKDVFGKPLVKIDWRWLPQDIETVRVALKALADDFAASGIAEFEMDYSLVEHEMLRDGAFGGHHIGTTRMADSPEKGVVDRDCKVFGIDNLYIASSSVFPTSGQANPTLLAIAMALRLADHIAPAQSGTVA